LCRSESTVLTIGLERRKLQSFLITRKIGKSMLRMSRSMDNARIPAGAFVMKNKPISPASIENRRKTLVMLLERGLRPFAIGF